MEHSRLMQAWDSRDPILCHGMLQKTPNSRSLIFFSQPVGGGGLGRTMSANVSTMMTDFTSLVIAFLVPSGISELQILGESPTVDVLSL